MKLATLLLILLCKTALSQDIVDKYYNFGGYISTGDEEKALALAEKILPETSSLSERKQAIFCYKLAGLYESRKIIEKAIDFYERSLKFEPNYYVPHLALGYLYLSKANIFALQINAERSNALLHKKYMDAYNAQLWKALPHLEKAMACDPNDQVLLSIKKGYQSLKDQAFLNLLDLRLNEFRKECVPVLTED